MRLFGKVSSRPVLVLAIAGVAVGRAIFPGKIITRSSEVLSKYDYIVVGGGTSGLVVAERLSENPGRLLVALFQTWLILTATTVLIIEAGSLYEILSGV